MMNKKTFGNNVLVKLDPPELNEKIGNLYVDTSFDPEKHVTCTGVVVGLPSKLTGMPWTTQIEIQIGDHVIVHYLSVLNAFRKEYSKSFTEGDDRYVFIAYQSVYVIIRDEKIIPINGYCLLEPCDDPFWEKKVARLRAIGLEPVRLNLKTNTHVCFGRVKYLSVPISEYSGGQGDERGIDLKEGDICVMKKVSDILVQFDLHTTIDGNKKFYRVQRRHILAKV